MGYVTTTYDERDAPRLVVTVMPMGEDSIIYIVDYEGGASITLKMTSAQLAATREAIARYEESGDIVRIIAEREAVQEEQ